MEGIEVKYAEKCNELYDKLMDLNVPMSTIAHAVTPLLALRSQLLMLYGVPPDPKWKPNTPAAGSPAAVAVGDREINYKSKLNEAFGKRHKRALTKDDFLYSTETSDGGFVCTLTSASLTGEYHSAAPCASKKAAESAAALAALQAEFPECLVEAPSLSAVAAPAAGQKRKEMVELVGKQKLTNEMQILLGRTTTKDDIVFNTVAVDEDVVPNTFRSTVSLPTWDEQTIKSFTGQEATSKKAAEASAAEAASKEIVCFVQPAMEEHNAKKAKKNQEALAKLKAATAEKKAAAKAA